MTEKPPFSPKMPLRLLLVVPFVVQVAIAVGLVGYLSFRNGQRAVNDLAQQLRHEVTQRIEDRLNDYLKTPHLINQINANDVKIDKLNLQNFQQLERHFWQQIQLFESTSYIYFGGQGEIFIGSERVENESPDARDDTFNVAYWSGKSQDRLFYTYRTNRRGDRLPDDVQTSDYEMLSRPWYRAAIKAQKPIWGDIYVWSAPYPNIALPAVLPYYDNKDEFQGVFAVDLSLLDISQFLQTLSVGQNGETFIMERDGELVASSTTQLPFVNADEQTLRMQTTEVNNALIRQTAYHLSQKFGSFKDIQTSQQLVFKIAGDRQLVQVTPYQDEYGLDWLIVVVVPEQDFMGQIQQNTRITLVLCAIAFLVAIGVGIQTSHWIAKPILILGKVSRDLARGDLDRDVQPYGGKPVEISELTVLSDSFGQMAHQLNRSFSALEKMNEQLEQQVQERTASLAAAEAELRGLFEAMTELIFIKDRQGRYLKVVSSGSHLLKKSSMQWLRGQREHDILPQEQADRFVGYIQQALDRGETVNVEYEVTWQERSTWFAANITPISSDWVVWVARDISDRVAAEQALQDREAYLRLILDNIPQQVFWKDTHLVFQGCNKNWATAAGLASPEEAIGKTDFDLLPNPEIAEEFRGNDWAVIQSGEAQLHEITIDQKQTSENRKIWLDVNKIPIRDAQGEVVGVLGVLEDISDRVVAQQEIQLLLTLSQAISAAPDFNEALAVALRLVCETTGWVYGEAWIPGEDESALECSPCWYANEDYRDRLQEFRHYSEALTFLPGEGLPGRAWETQQSQWVDNLSTSEGDVFMRLELAEQSGLNAGFSVPILADRTSAIGRPALVLAVLVFFTRSHLEDERMRGLVSGVAAQIGAVLQQKRAFAAMKALFGAMTDLLTVRDVSGRCLNIVPTNAQFWDRELNLAIGQTLHETLPSETADLILQTIQRTVSQQQTETIEYCIPLPGRSLWIAETISPLTAETAILVARDISDRKLAEAALRLEQEKSEKLLLNILPKPIADRLKHSSGTIAEQFDEVTILFADIVGFTPLSGRLQPIELVNLLNQVFSEFDRIADRYDLEKIKTIGDAYMVVGGLPVPAANHAEAIAEMALEMQSAIAHFRTEVQEEIEIRIGINTGSVVAGTIGIKKFIYDLWGDAVNVASRMESQGIPGKIQVTEATYERLDCLYHFEKREAISVKGKGKMQTYWLLDRKQVNQG
ncbi:MAG: adenylate/guanylate cyclase domain-containing protein [Jaaginema sp. PMC 1079.18]|nr:adenylate/guanylate cyclase domain-containing protein [Jaaginema sp. PMC 1080.18]MEC4849625.1 adenylate/guanylate cyclase domain-containing protein [Jaaginema sp. PMC 1079.18]MEC4866201.1 adenylate/guanylate cyclase domain-containing protein [Jaaginema sp. PMC 1078.18]